MIHVVLAMKPLSGSFVENAVEYSVAGINIDRCRVGNFTPSQLGGMGNPSIMKTGEPARGDGFKGIPVLSKSSGRFPANIILDAQSATTMDDQSGISKSSGGSGKASREWQSDGRTVNGSCRATSGLGDVGGTSRYFKVILEE